MPGQTYNRIFEVALDQYGYFTAKQARENGVSTQALAKMVSRGTVGRQGRGLYNIPAIPVGSLAPYMEAVLWPYPVRGIISHETALDLYDVSDINPASVHITVPQTFRSRRVPPRHYALHRAHVNTEEVGSIEGIPVTTLRRTILDCYVANVGSELVAQSIENGLLKGRLSIDDAEYVRRLVSPLAQRRWTKPAGFGE